MKRLCLLFSLILPLLAVSPATYSVQAQNPASEATGAGNNPWTGYVLLKHIASCESWGDPNKEPRQFDENGHVLRGYPNPADIGLAQINEPLWGKKALSMGWDIHTYEGNLSMAKWLFDHFGDKPWNWSKGCWGRYE